MDPLTEHGAELLDSLTRGLKVSAETYRRRILKTENDAARLERRRLGTKAQRGHTRARHEGEYVDCKEGTCPAFRWLLAHAG